MKIRAFVAHATARWCPLPKSVRISTRNFYRKGKTYPGLRKTFFLEDFRSIFHKKSFAWPLSISECSERGKKKMTANFRSISTIRSDKSINRSLARICPWVYWLLQQNMERFFAQVVITRWPIAMWLTKDNLHSAKKATHIRLFLGH